MKLRKGSYVWIKWFVTTSTCKDNVYTHVEIGHKHCAGWHPWCCRGEVREVNLERAGCCPGVLGWLPTSPAPAARALLTHGAGSRQGHLSKRVVKTPAALCYGSEILQLVVCWLSNIRRTGWSLIEVQLESNKHFQQHLQGKDPTW